MSKLSRIQLVLTVAFLVASILIINYKADGFYSGPRENQFQNPPQPTITATSTPVPPFVGGEREEILCTTDCAVRPVEVCTRDGALCTYVDGLYCTQRIENSCEQVLIELVD